MLLVTLTSTNGKEVSFQRDQLGAISGHPDEGSFIVLKLKIEDENISFYVKESPSEVRAILATITPIPTTGDDTIPQDKG